ncbi:MAG: hypothetical protein ABSH29_25595 [Acidimicrobiales bacterium]
MPPPTWAEYLHAASAYLKDARRTAERGAPPPAPPARPGGPIPAECRSAALALAAGYDLLAEEVVARMSIIEQRRPSAIRLNAPREQPLPRYIDTPI